MSANNEIFTPSDIESFHYEAALHGILRASGWYHNRHVPFTEFRKFLEFRKEPVHSKACEFLHEFYGLGITTHRYGVENLREGICHPLPVEKQHEQLLIVNTMGFGVDADGNYWLPKRPFYDSTDTKAFDGLRRDLGCSVCLIGYWFRRYARKESWLRRLFGAKPRYPTTDGMLLKNNRAYFIYMAEDGRVVTTDWCAASATVYNNYKSYFYCCFQPFISTPEGDVATPERIVKSVEAEYWDFG